MTREEALYKVNGYLTDIIPVENYSEVEEIIKALEQEPCKDCISRQGAINEIKNVFDDILCCNVSVRKGLPEAVRRIEMMPSAEQKEGWIPVSEGLPKECDGCVLVSRENGQVTTGLYSEFSNVWYIGDMCGVGGCKVIAWMPLPEPYKEDGEK